MGKEREGPKRSEDFTYKCNSCRAVYRESDIPEGKRCKLSVQKGTCAKPCNWTGVISLNQRECPRCRKKLVKRRLEICQGILLPLVKR